MIREVQGNVYDNLPKYSVIVHQCSTKGWLDSPLSKELNKRWPANFKEYHDYCKWFQDGHEDEILGTFARYSVSPSFIICNAITQVNTGKSKTQLDLDAFDAVCRKIRRQTKYVNEKTGKNWTLHMQYKNGCNSKTVFWENIMEILEKHFAESPVELVIHRY